MPVDGKLTEEETEELGAADTAPGKLVGDRPGNAVVLTGTPFP